MIGQLGAVALSVHAIAGQVVAVAFMLPFGFGIAMSIRIGNIIPQSAIKAKVIAYNTFMIGAIIFLIMSICIYLSRRDVVAMFTKEAIVVLGCYEIWDKVVFYSFNLSLYAMLLGIYIGLGKQAILGCICIIYLWIVGLPITYYFAIHRGGGFNTAWKVMCPIYLGINATLIRFLTRMDWEHIAKQVRLREGVSEISNVGKDMRQHDKLQYGTI
jgi:multidrug resistance protein, MATE family